MAGEGTESEISGMSFPLHHVHFIEVNGRTKKLPPPLLFILSCVEATAAVTDQVAWGGSLAGV